MIEIVSISLYEFKFLLKSCQCDKKWFYDILSSNNSSKYNLYSIQLKNVKIGLIVNYKEISENEFGICIFDDFKSHGFGTNVIIRLFEKTNGLISFTINEKNSNSVLFFDSLVSKNIIGFENVHLI